MPWPIFETKAQVPDNFLPMYEERGGKWVVQEKHVVKDDDPLGEAGKKAIEAEREKREAAEAARKKAEEDLKAAQQATKDAKDALTKAQREAEAQSVGKTSAELAELTEKIRADVDLSKADELKALTDRIAELEGVTIENRDLKLVQKVKAQMAKSGVRKEKIEDLWTLEGGEFELTADDVPKPKNHPSLTTQMFIEDKLKKSRPDYFEGSKADGSGSGSHLKGIPGSGITADDILANPTQALTLAHEKGKG